MSKASRWSSLLQTRDSDSHSHSHSHSHSRSHSHAHSLFHRLRRNPFLSRDPNEGNASNIAEHDPASKVGGEGELDSDNDSLAKRDRSAVVEKSVNAVGSSQESFVTRVVQTISLVQYVDPWGSAFKTQTVFAAPNTVVIDPESGKTVVISVGTPSSAAPPRSTPGGSGLASSSSNNTAQITHKTKLTSSLSARSTKSAFPSLVDIRNSTNSNFHANSSAAASTNVNNKSIHKPTSYSGPALISTSELHLTTSSQAQTTASSSTISQSSYSTLSTSSLGDGYRTLTVAGSHPTSPSAGTGSDGSGGDGGGIGGSGGSGGSGIELTPQQKQVIGGVVGGIAGVAIIGLLLMLFLRYKKRKGGQLLLDSQSGTTITRFVGDVKPAGGSGAAMAERSTASGAVASALASLTGKKSPPVPPPTATGERGFYRVSGRKLPSVFHNGGDGYSDPRQSAASGSSDYYRGSQAFEPGSGNVAQLALGSPMRPVSGVPVMRSGPARVAITKNPFADPKRPTTPTNLSSPTLGTRDSPRASGSRFQEGI